MPRVPTDDCNSPGFYGDDIGACKAKDTRCATLGHTAAITAATVTPTPLATTAPARVQVDDEGQGGPWWPTGTMGSTWGPWEARAWAKRHRIAQL